MDIRSLEYSDHRGPAGPFVPPVGPHGPPAGTHGPPADPRGPPADHGPPVALHTPMINVLDVDAMQVINTAAAADDLYS